jgi:hypothetical protein
MCDMVASLDVPVCEITAATPYLEKLTVLRLVLAGSDARFSRRLGRSGRHAATGDGGHP